MRTNAIRHDAVFQRYLDVVNRTLVEVKDRFPYNSLLGSLEEALAGRPLMVEIDDEPVGCVLEDLAFRVSPVAAPTTATRCRISREHVEAVVNEPWRYLADPSRLELPPFNLVGARRAAPLPASPRRRHVHASRP